jgi:predicted dehydrogenase
MTDRRSFLKSAAAAGGFAFLPSWSFGREFGPNDRLNVALIGVGGIGGYAINSLIPDKRVKIVALCDVDDDRAAKNYKKFPDIIRKFRDYRVMFDKMGKQIDAVVISTPDHMHYPIAAWAIANGKHVFCQKPLTRTIWEANDLKKRAKEAGVITQMGNQGHTKEGWRLIKEWYDAGIIGEIEDIYIWTNRPIWPQGDLKMPREKPVPPTLDYNCWLGVAPYQPYNPKVLPFNWRGLRNYGTGAAGDMACHFLDVPYSAFDLGYPYKVIGESTPFNDYSWPKEASSVMTFLNKRGVNGRIKLHWYDGGRKPKEIKRVDKSYLDDPRNNNATFIVGTKETVFTNEYGENTRIWPPARMKELLKSNALPKPTIKRSEFPNNPFSEWAKACLEGKQPPANFDYAAPFTEMALLGMIALCVPNTELKYMPSKMSFLGCPEADKYVRSLYDYRSEFLPSKISLF